MEWSSYKPVNLVHVLDIYIRLNYVLKSLEKKSLTSGFNHK